MITRVHIKSFRSCEDVLLENIGLVLALVGRNGAGKTNILRAIDLVAKQATTELARVGGHSIAVDVDLDNQRLRYEQNYSVHLEKNADGKRSPPYRRISEHLIDLNNNVIIFSRTESILSLIGHDDFTISRTTPALKAITSLFPEHKNISEMTRLLSFFSRIHYSPLVELDSCDEPHWIFGDEYREFKDEYAILDGPERFVTKTLVYLQKEENERFKEIEAILGPSGLGIFDRILVINHATTRQAQQKEPSEKPVIYSVEFKLIESETRRRFSQLSLGTRRVVRLVLQLTDSRNAALLFEHPEDGIHRGLLTKVVDIIRTNADPLQVLMTSHSPYVLNSLTAENIRLVYFQKGMTRCRSLSTEEQRHAASYLEKEGTLSEFIELIEE
ncbi:MAG: AAA family ATPase [Pirellula sp.]